MGEVGSVGKEIRTVNGGVWWGTMGQAGSEGN